MINSGAVDNAADELAESLECCVSTVTQLGGACGDELLINDCVYQLQVRHRPTCCQYR